MSSRRFDPRQFLKRLEILTAYNDHAGEILDVVLPYSGGSLLIPHRVYVLSVHIPTPGHETTITVAFPVRADNEMERQFVSEKMVKHQFRSLADRDFTILERVEHD